MKKLKLLSFLLTMLALAFGADLSMAAVAAGDNEPIERTADPDTKDLNTDLTGSPGTEKQVKDSDINSDEIDDGVISFQAFHYTLSTYIERVAKQKQVTDYQVKHPVMATPIMDCANRKAITASSQTEITLSIGASSTNVTAAESRMFGKSQTFIVKGVPGYKYDGTNNVEDGELMMKVVGRASDGILCIPINGYWSGSAHVIHDDIPLGAKFQMMATAGHTAQLVVSPKNQMPVFVNATLQKKIMNTMLEKEWAKKKKEIPWFVDDVADNAVMTFRQENERTKLLGVSGMLVEHDEKLGEVNCYYEEGVMNQLLMKYVTTDVLTYKDLIAITKMQFGKWSASNEAYLFASYGLVEQMLNLDFTKVAQTNVLATTDKWGIDITEFKTTFGKLKIVLCPILDEMGFENCGMVIDMGNAVHYWKKPNVAEKSNEDLSKGGDEPIEANRDRYIKIDCCCLRGYNSILIGPADKIMGVETQYDNRSDIYKFNKKVSSTYYTLAKLSSDGDGTAATSPEMWVGSGATGAPATWADGLLVYLETDDDNTGGTGLTAGTIAKWNATSSQWEKYSGAITA